MALGQGQKGFMSMMISRRSLFGFLSLIPFTPLQPRPMEIVIGHDDIIGIPFRRDVRLAGHSPAPPGQTPWELYEYASGAYIPLPNGRRIPVTLRTAR